jgi:hypothetical protein
MCGVLQAAFGLPPTYQSKQLTAVQQHMASCVRTIALRHFPTGRPVSVSIPSDELQTTNSSQSEDNQHMVSYVLRELNDMMRWPILIFTSNILTDDTSDEVIIPHSYIIFLWPQQDESIYDTIQTQMQNQQDSPSWNPGAKFLVVVTGHDSEPHTSVARHICEILWEIGKISSIVVLIPNSSQVSTLSHTSLMAVEETKTFDLYTFFPYKPGNCGKVTDIIIIDKWHLEQNGSFQRNTNLFPPKIPQDFMGCPIRVSSIGFQPFVNLKSSHKRQDGSILYDVAGTYVEYFLIPMKKMNLSAKFLSPKLDPSPDAFMELLADQIDGVSDIIIGFVPLFPIVAIPETVYTVPHSCALFSLFVPCPPRVYKTGKLFSTFTFPVWLTLALAFLMTSATFWCLENKSRRSNSKISRITTSTFLPVYNAWAILLAVSVPKMPKTWTHRFLFLFYVCFCFAMVTVFQTFFVSYLVEPGLGEKITLPEEAVASDLIYAYHPMLDFFLNALDYNRYKVDLPESRRLECLDLVECTKRLIIQRDVMIINAYFYVKYIASLIGISDYTKGICHIDESFTLYVTFLLQKGSPFLDGMNRLVRQCLESGLYEKLWADTHLRALVQSMGKNELLQENTGTFFAFEIHHLSAAFFVLIVGNILSCIVLVLEIIHKRLSVHRHQIHVFGKRHPNF